MRAKTTWKEGTKAKGNGRGGEKLCVIEEPWKSPSEVQPTTSKHLKRVQGVGLLPRAELSLSMVSHNL